MMEYDINIECFSSLDIRLCKAVPSRKTWRRPLMVRQPYSEAVLSTGGRLHPRFLRKRGLGRRWSSPWRTLKKSLLGVW